MIPLAPISCKLRAAPEQEIIGIRDYADPTQMPWSDLKWKTKVNNILYFQFNQRV